MLIWHFYIHIYTHTPKNQGCTHFLPLMCKRLQRVWCLKQEETFIPTSSLWFFEFKRIQVTCPQDQSPVLSTSDLGTKDQWKLFQSFWRHQGRCLLLICENIQIKIKQTNIYHNYKLIQTIHNLQISNLNTKHDAANIFFLRSNKFHKSNIFTPTKNTWFEPSAKLKLLLFVLQNDSCAHSGNPLAHTVTQITAQRAVRKMKRKAVTWTLMRQRKLHVYSSSLFIYVFVSWFASSHNFLHEFVDAYIYILIDIDQ